MTTVRLEKTSQISTPVFQNSLKSQIKSKQYQIMIQKRASTPRQNAMNRIHENNANKRKRHSSSKNRNFRMTDSRIKK